MCMCVRARPIIVSYGRPSHIFNGMRVCNVTFDVLFLNRYVAYRFFFSRNKYIDIELPSLICTKFPFSLLALHYPPTQLLTRIHTCASARAGPTLLLCPSSSFFFPLSPLQLAAPLAHLSPYSRSAHARLHLLVRTPDLALTQPNEFAHTTRVPFSFVFFSSFSFIPPQPPSRETTLAAAARRE